LGLQIQVSTAKESSLAGTVSKLMATTKFFDQNSLLTECRRLLPQPVRESVRREKSHVFIGGSPGEVVIRVRGDRITVAEFAVVWDSPYSVVMRPNVVASIKWTALPREALVTTLQALIEAISVGRRAKYRTCRFCGKTIPPESQHDDSACHGCAEQHLGVVH
jgi:hypothetical protein